MMTKIENILKTIVNLWNFLSGKSARHNRALRHVRDWSATVPKFLSDYRLSAGADMAFLLENTRQANFDLIAMTHKGNELVKPAAQIKGAPVSPLLTKVVDEIENMRRAMMSPVLRSQRLPEVVTRLRASSEKLQEKLASLEFM
jgi:hypothetical protein